MMKQIILGGGCFWCTEAAFWHIKGVQSVTSGYAGGQAHTANYEAVCNGDTGHIEVIKVIFDNQVIDLSVILDIFFVIHDPTTPNRQGNDIGTQYASVIFYKDDDDLSIIKNKINQLQSDGIAVITRVEKAPPFYIAESYHQNFYAKNPTQGYCHFVIPPKLTKLRNQFTAFFKN